MKKLIVLFLFILTTFIYATQINVVGEVFTETW